MKRREFLKIPVYLGAIAAVPVLAYVDETCPKCGIVHPWVDPTDLRAVARIDLGCWLNQRLNEALARRLP